MRSAVGVWRWRQNPLRRRTDLVEAWVALAALVLMVLASPVLGSLCGAVTDRALQRTVTREQRERHATTAVVVHQAHERSALAGAEGVGGREGRIRVVANWTAYDGTLRTGTVAAPRRSAPSGSTFRIWTDDRGMRTSRPLDSTTAHAHAVFAGIGAAAAAAGLVEGIRRLVVWRLVRRRYARLDRAWAGYGPDWGRAGAGS
ncbi:hypothetical protein [Streptomyces sp. BPTC-684]|uniref:Rv1733c family protein n=1 Tax=Streptomyces sp. BPTC-684 TaxID=3043734 RepID=UPI0024B168F1|nr:hypothetical protein [Streptomyces sp. BPTC-684]WHM40013.1 hypothetical protein QIY60_26275 [Streptomyces sp. BPTC-684]